MRRILQFSILILLSQTVIAQSSWDFRPPLDFQMYLSGNFGELRGDHFHSGIDIKTQGVAGKQVHAADSGYVSRIKVEPGGYGKAIYLAHPNGFTTVYGHLSNYNATINDFVRKKQYSLRSHSVDIYLKPGDLPVKKGEVIAFSGNTGSSSGPHLHFEVRRTADQHPLNVLRYDFPIKDKRPPEFKKLVIYPRSYRSQVKNSPEKYISEPTVVNGKYTVNSGKPVLVYGDIGLGIEVYDYLDGAANRCGVYSIELLIDGKRKFLSEMNEFSFSESRFINAHIDYALKYETKSSVQRLYKLPYNELSILKFLDNDGISDIRDSLVHEVTIRAVDSYGNFSDLNFSLKGTGSPVPMISDHNFNGKILPYNAPSGFSDRNIELRFPAYCFYEDVEFSYARISGSGELFSDIYTIHSEKTPVHKSYSISITPDEIPSMHPEKLCLIAFDELGEASYAGGEFEDGKISAELRSFGKYAVSIDTLAPEIRPLNFYSGKDLDAQADLRLEVKDDLSGIASYNGYIDNQWVLFEYDPKNDLLTYEFDSKVPISKKNHELEVYLSDEKGNTNVYHTIFYR